MDQFRLQGGSVSEQLLGPGLTALEDNPALLELQSYYDLYSCAWRVEMLRQEAKAACFQHRHRPSSRTIEAVQNFSVAD